MERRSEEEENHSQFHAAALNQALIVLFVSLEATFIYWLTIGTIVT